MKPKHTPPQPPHAAISNKLPTPADLALLSQVVQKVDPNWEIWDDSMRLIFLMGKWSEWEKGILDYRKTETEILAAPPPPAPPPEKQIPLILKGGELIKEILGTKNLNLVRSYFYEVVREARGLSEIEFYKLKISKKTGKQPRLENRDVNEMHQWAADMWRDIKSRGEIPESIFKMMKRQKEFRDGAANRKKNSNREAKDNETSAPNNPQSGVADLWRVHNARIIELAKLAGYALKTDKNFNDEK